jgi:para-aminobenzoate synthetase component 1
VEASINMPMNREAFILEMNRLGCINIPFCFVIDFEQIMPKLWRLDQPQDDFMFMFNGKTSHETELSLPCPKKSFRFEKRPIAPKEYERMFNLTVNHIQKGDSYLVNLTADTKVDTDLTPEELFRIGTAKYKCILKNQFVCFSPETFVHIENGYIRAYPMKGTIDGSIPQAREQIMQDEKEAAEHATIVDLIRNDLSRVSTSIRVERFRYYEVIQSHYGQLGQVSSEISGKLPADYRQRIGDIIFELLPAGSISGAPKRRTLEIIQEAEGRERGFYTGIAGYFENGELDSCVLIRFMKPDGTYSSGGGITCESLLDAEYQEMINKVYVPIH